MRIAEFAETISAHFSPQGSLCPISVIEKVRDLTWSHGDYGDKFDGLIRFNGRSFHIYLNRERCARIRGCRGAFTLAHELGHYFIDNHNHWLRGNPNWAHYSRTDEEDEDEAPYERDADVFATSLLMPAKEFHQFTSQFRPSAEAIIAAARHFGVSIPTAAIRVTEIEPWPCAVIHWGRTGLKKWAKVSPVVKRAFRILREYHDVTKSLSGDLAISLTAKALNQQAIGGSQKSIPEPWFPRLRIVEQYRGFPMERLLQPIDEHVISLGEHGVMTLLSSPTWYGMDRL
jgi:Zn-dependent peptidase ImmA (M78 family)